MEFIINDRKKKFRDIFEMYSYLLIFFVERVPYLSAESITDIVSGIKDVVVSHEREEIESYKGLPKKDVSSKRIQLTRFINKLSDTVSKFKKIKKQDVALKTYYNLILSQEKMGLLGGFSIAASITIGGQGVNPEQKSIYSKFR